MITPAKISSEIAAINKLKKIKISVWNAFVYVSVISGGIFLYYSTFKPIRENSAKIPGIEKQVNDLQKNIVPADTSIYTVIRETHVNIGSLEIEVNKLNGQMLIMGEEFPGLQKRFDDLEKGFNEQYEKTTGTKYDFKGKKQ